MADKQLREDVVSAMAAVAYEAEKAGNDGWKAIEDKFPGTPSEVFAVAYVRATDQATEEWWQQVERTVDVEAVRKAVVAVADRSGG